MNSNKRRTIVLTTILAMILALVMNANAQDRMPPIPADKLTEEQKNALAEFVAARGAPTGPWVVLLRSPEVMSRARALSDYLRFNSVLPPRLSEFIILMMARQWTQQYEWNAHYQLALNGGLDPDVAKAIAEGRRPERMKEDEEILYEFYTDLQRNNSVSDVVYARAVSKFGEQGVVDTVSLMGYYTLISMILNTARTPLPANVTPALTPFPR